MSQGLAPYRNVLDGYESQELGLGITTASELMGEYYVGIQQEDATGSASFSLAASADPSMAVSAQGATGTGGLNLAAMADPSIAVSVTAATDLGMTLAAVADPTVTVPTTASAALTLAAVARRATGGLYTAGDFGKAGIGQNAKAAPARRPTVPVERKHQDDATSKFAREVRDSIKAAADSPIPWGRLVTVEFETAGTPIEISGPPDRPPVGYIVVGLSAEAVIYDADPPNAPRRGSIWLQSSGAVTAKLWVF